MQTETLPCNICGKIFSRPRSQGIIVCPECHGDKEKARNRIFTKDTVMLVCKWYGEGKSVRKISGILNRSEENIRLALEQGGIIT